MPASIHGDVRSALVTEVWWRNPEFFIKETMEIGENKIAFDRGYCIKRSLNAERWCELHFGTLPWRMLLIGTQGSVELGPENGLKNPKAVYGTWAYGEDFDALEELCSRNIGLDEEYCSDLSIPTDERPVLNQPHRVIVTDLPDAKTGPVRRTLQLIKELQQDYFDCIIHVHGLYGFRPMFNNDFGAVDYDPRILAKKGKVVLGSGKEMTYEQAAHAQQWVNLVGMRPDELKIPRNRCMFNMKSALWAADNFRRDVKFKSSGYTKVDPDAEFELAPTTNAVRTKTLPVLAGDKFLCDSCSLQNTCKYFRVGDVCSIPGSEPSELVRLFKTRDADTIIDGLGSVLAIQTNRLTAGVENEEEYGELDSEVTKIANSILTHGNKLAKLLNPALNGGPKVGVFVNGQANVVADPSQITATIVRELEAQGVPRDKITADMIAGAIERMGQQAIEVKSKGAK